MTNNDLFMLDDLIGYIFNVRAQDTSINSKFLYALRRNRDIIGAEIVKLREKIIAENKPDDELQAKMKEHEEKRIEACKEFAEKNEQGEAVIENGVFKIQEDKKEEFNKLMEKLGEEYPEVVEARKKQILNERNVLMAPIEEGVVLYKIKKDCLPEKDVITPELMNVLYELVED